MAKREYDKYIVYETPPNPFHPPGSFPGTEMFVVNNEIIKGAPRVMCAWFAGPWPIDDIFKPHCHNNEEMILFIGSDPENPRELGGEIEFWFKDEKYLITKSCAIFVPKMLQHAPMIPTRVDDPKKPILFVGTVLTTEDEDIMYYSRDPKWSKYKDPPPWPGVRWMD